MNTITKLFTAALSGIDGTIVTVESDTNNSLPTVSIVGLPDTVIQESKERIRSAIKNSRLLFPRKKVTINLAPADVKKEGTHYDVPIALSILLAGGDVRKKITLQDTDLFLGELGLSGEIRNSKGVLPMTLLAHKHGFKRIFIPKVNMNEALLVAGVKIVGVDTLASLVQYLAGEENDAVAIESPGITDVLYKDSEEISDEDDFSYIHGQEQVKRALEIAAAGNHNVFMTGSPGSGKTLLARAFRSILPPLTKQEIIEITSLYSAFGELRTKTGVLLKRPFRQPHHSASLPALVGGGNSIRPGEVSMAHRGVLFLDECGEFHRSVLESLRQPLEEGHITVARAKGTARFPARFILIAAQNPCPCGYYGDAKRQCTCTIGQVQKYQQKMSGPLMDRIDMHIAVPPVDISDVSASVTAESSHSIRERVVKARHLQYERLREIGKLSNAELSVREIHRYIPLQPACQELLLSASERLFLSARAYFRVLRVARTIADLDASVTVEVKHIAEALQYRMRQDFS